MGRFQEERVKENMANKMNNFVIINFLRSKK